MKKLFMILAAAFAVVACSDDDGGSTLDGLVIDAKWVFESGEYASFEFNDTGDYIVVLSNGAGSVLSSPSRAFAAPASSSRSESVSDSVSDSDTESYAAIVSSSVIVGDYESDGDFAVKMIGFGRVELDTMDTDDVSFSLTLEGENEVVSYTASVAPAVATSDTTTMLCRMWDLVSYTKDGVNVDFDDDDAKTVLFSKAGTYLVEYRDGSTGLAQWKWKSESDKTFYFTWSGVWNDDRYVTLTTLTSSKLVIKEDMGGDDEVDVTTLTPSK